MAILPTMKLRHKYNGSIRIVNETTYALNLGAWGDYDVISARHGNATDKEILFEKNQEIIEKIRQSNPNSPAFGDAKNAYEQRAIEVTTNIKADLPDEKVGQYTSAVKVEVEPEAPGIEEREVPVIGGKQTVKVNAGKRAGRPPKANQDEVL